TGALHDDETPLISLLLPGLGLGHIDGLVLRGSSRLNLGLELDDLNSGLRRTCFHIIDLEAACLQPHPEIDIGIGSACRILGFYLWLGAGAVQRFQSDGIAGQDRALPLFEWSERR